MLETVAIFSAKHWKAVAGGLLFAVLAASSWLGWSRADHWHKRYNTQVTLYAKLKTDIIDQTKAAEAQALAAKQKQEAEYAQAAKNADASYDALRARYAALLRSKAGSGAAGKADLPGATQATGVPETTAPDASILISADDAMICAENTAKAIAAWEWVASFNP